MPTTRNAHFTHDTFRFLTELKLHNERAWFLDNKGRYETLVQQPFLAVIAELSSTYHSISPFLVSSPKPVGGSMLRVYRDTRFSSNKAPYKTYAAANFFHADGKNEPAPGFYLHVEPGHGFFGCGVWHPEPENRTKIAQAIVQNPDEWIRASQARSFTKVWSLSGETMKRVPRGFDPKHKLAGELIRKDFVATLSFTEPEMIDPAFVGQLKNAIRKAGPFMKFLTRAVGFQWDATDEKRRVDPLKGDFSQKF
jgi:uncharacterized protein (TIGR02453 family)